MLQSLQTACSNIKDFRVERNKNYSLNSIIFIVLCSALAGIDDWVGMEDYCEANFDFLKKHIDLSEGVPSHDTIGRVMSRIDFNIPLMNQSADSKT